VVNFSTKSADIENCLMKLEAKESKTGNWQKMRGIEVKRNELSADFSIWLW
jgi:hypothetical protein